MKNRRKMMFTGVISKVRPLAFFAFFAIAATLLPVAADAGTAELSWSAPSTNTDGSSITDLAGYKVYYGTAPGSYSNDVDAGKVTSYTVNDLAAGSTYYFAVTAYNSAGKESSYSTQVTKTMQVVDVTAPAVSGVYADNVTANSARINWSTNEKADSLVEYGTTLSYGYTNPLDTALTASHTQTVGGLSHSTLYNYRVTSKDASGNKTVSGNYTFTTAAPADTTAPAISNILVTDITSTSATVSWKTNEPSTTQVEYGIGSYSKASPLSTGKVTIHSVDLTGLAGFTPYDFRVKSADAAGNTATSVKQGFTTSNTIPSIGSFTASATSGNTPLAVNFAAAGADTDGFIAAYEWDFDGDGVYDSNTGSTGRASHTYGTAGTFDARVRVTDNGGAALESDATTITVSTSSAQPPVVNSISTTQDGSSMSMKFEVSVKVSGGSIVKYEWDFDGNGTIDATTASAPTTCKYSQPGTYKATVTVTDDKGATAKGQTTVTVDESVSGGSGVTPDSSGASLAGATSGACFIASAAYGSYLEPEVQVLRDFRDGVLLSNTAGKAFVSLYYMVSPPAADFISRHTGAKLAVRIALTPLVYGVKHPRVTLLLTLMFLSGAGFMLYRRKKGIR